MWSAVKNKFIKRTLFTEYTEAQEKKNYQISENLIKSRMNELFSNLNYALRDTHTKSHAAIKAELEIFDFNEENIKTQLKNNFNLPQTMIQSMILKKGLFKHANKYPVWLRFANGNGSKNSDKVSDTRSMSVKIIGVEGERFEESHETMTQDIITQNGDVFLANTISNYISFLQAIFKSKVRLVFWLISHPTQWLALIRITKHNPISLLTETYWSGSAYSLGDSMKTTQRCPDARFSSYPAVIKYAFIPTKSHEEDSIIPRQSIPSNLNIQDNYYREDIVAQLAKLDVEFSWNFAIQFQTNIDMSIDDITIPWSEKKSPFFTVGKLKVSHQIINYEKQKNFCEYLRFSPWNGLIEHRPVGALNRLRKYVYPIVATYRLNKTGVIYKEPTGKESFE